MFGRGRALVSLIFWLIACSAFPAEMLFQKAIFRIKMGCIKHSSFMQMLQTPQHTSTALLMPTFGVVPVLPRLPSSISSPTRLQ